jgi:hypothetical protein
MYVYEQTVDVINMQTAMVGSSFGLTFIISNEVIRFTDKFKVRLQERVGVGSRAYVDDIRYCTDEIRRGEERQDQGSADYIL